MTLRPVFAVALLCGGFGALLAGCSSDDAGAPGPTAGTFSTAGTGTGGSGAAGSANVGGTSVGPAGGSATAGAGASAGGMGTGGGVAGSSPVGGTGAGGTNAGGSAGTSGSGGGGGFTVPRGKSAGCSKPSQTEPGKYVTIDIDVTGVDPYWGTVKMPHPNQNPPGHAPYTFTKRSFGIRLPTGYDASKPYPLVFQGGGCGNTQGNSGSTGGEKMIPDSAGGDGIAVGLSYVYPEGAGACFADEYENTYEMPYWEAVYKAVTDAFCVDLEKVFIGGYSSGAWMAYTTAFAKSGKIRGMAAGAGGVREKHPPRSNIPFAALMITGATDTTNPVHKTVDKSCNGSEAEGCWNGKIICGFPGAETCVDTGSAAARDEILKINGCVGTATQPYGEWADCKQYTGCPAAFPVVYCMPNDGHTSGGARLNPGAWNLWKSLPPVP